MALGTANGPTRLGPLLRVMSAASTMARVEGPPEPMMMPVISWETSSGSSPASRIACSMAMWFQAAPPPRNRMARRSTTPSGSRLGAPCTWQRNPSSAYLSARTIPDFASRRLARTSWVLFPIDETMPMPVTTTRLMEASSAVQKLRVLLPGTLRTMSGAPSCAARLHLFLTEQADLEIHGPVDDRAIGLEPAVRDAQHQLGSHDPLDVDAVDHLLHGGQNLARELDFAEPQRPSFSGRAEPSEEEAQQLPQCIETKTARHHRITFEVAREIPEIGLHIEHGAHQALAVLAPDLGDLGDTVEHEHGGQRQLGIAGPEQFAAAAGQE